MTAEGSVFCQAFIAFVLLTAAGGKLRDVGAFARTLRELTPMLKAVVRPIALGLLATEVGIALLIIGPPQTSGVGLAASLALLVAFSVVIAAQIARRRGGACNCFGIADRPVSLLDLARNAGLLFVVIVGLALRATTSDGPDSGTEASIAAALSACITGALWMRLPEVVQFVRAT